MPAIAFIGLGNMGGPMAANLVRAGHLVTGFDLIPAALDALRHAGGTASASARDAAAGAEIVVTMLPAGEHLRALLAGPDGLIRTLAAGTLLIDCSTIDVATARAVADEASAAGLSMLDAPVSGGTGGAAAGTLTFMVGGGADAVARAEPVLRCMGKTIVHAGGAGAGQAAKICNNMILGASMLAVSEAFVLADSLGLSHDAMFRVASTSSGQCWSLTTYCPVPGPVPGSPANRDYAGGFSAALMLKDLRLSQAAAAETGAATPMGARAAETYEKIVEAGQGGRDFSVAYPYLAGRT